MPLVRDTFLGPVDISPQLKVTPTATADGVKLVGDQGAANLSPALALFDQATARGYLALAASGAAFFASAAAGDILLRAETGNLLLGKNGNDFAAAVNARNLGIGTTSQFGSGSGVLGIHDAPTAPSTTPTAGGVLSSQSGQLHWKSSNGNDYALTPPTGTATPAVKTANYTLLSTDSTIVTNSTSALTMTLPAGSLGATFTIKNINSGQVTVATTSGTIDGATTDSIGDMVAHTYQCYDGTNWIRV